jgi:hypothetical protein
MYVCASVWSQTLYYKLDIEGINPKLSQEVRLILGLTMFLHVHIARILTRVCMLG